MVVESAATLLHNVTKPPNGGLSPYELRFGVAFNGPLLAFGSEISYKSAVSEPNGPGNKFGPSSKQGVIVGYSRTPVAFGARTTLSSISKQCATTRTAEESVQDVAAKCSRNVEHRTSPC